MSRRRTYSYRRPLFSVPCVPVVLLGVISVRGTVVGAEVSDVYGADRPGTDEE